MKQHCRWQWHYMNTQINVQKIANLQNIVWGQTFGFVQQSQHGHLVCGQSTVARQHRFSCAILNISKQLWYNTFNMQS